MILTGFARRFSPERFAAGLKLPRGTGPAALLGAIALALPGLLADAADGAWINGTTNSAWTNAANWLNGQIADGADAVAAFNTLDLTANRTVNLNASRVIGGLVFGDTVASNAWTLANGSGGTFALTLSHSSGKPTMAVENQSATISAVLEGVQGFTKTGAGTLTLSGANTISGGITLAQGTLAFANGALTGNAIELTATSTVTWSGTNTQDISSQLLVQDGVTATLNTGANSVLFASPLQLGASGTAAVTKSGAGTLTITAANTFTGAFRANAGRVVLAGGNDRLAGSVPVTIGQGANSGILQLGDVNAPSDQTVASLVTAGTGSANAIVGGNEAISTLTVNNATGGTFAGRIGGAGPNEDRLALVKTGAGPWTLSGSNSFTGDVEVRGGALIVTNASALGSGAKTVTISGSTNAPTLQLNQPTGIALPAELRMVTSNDQSGAPAILNAAGQNAIAGPIALAAGGFGGGHTRITVNAGSLTLAGGISPADDAATARTLILDGTGSGAVESVIANGAVSVALTKAGGGTWTLNAANTYSGTTAINAGKLSVNSVLPTGTPQPLGTASSAILIGSNGGAGTLEYTGTDGATLSRNVTVNGSAGAVLQNSGGGTLTLGGTINKNARPLTFSGGDFSITGRITGGASTTPLLISGATVSLWNAGNSFGGLTAVSGGGRLTLGASGVLPDGSDMTLGEDATNTGGALDLNGNDESIGGLASVGSGDVVVTNGAATGTATLRITGSGTFTGRITDGPSAATSLEIASAGTQTLTGENSYTGPTTVSAGTLVISGSLTGSTRVRLSGGELTLGASNVLNDAVELTLQGGVFNTGGFSEGTAGASGLGSLSLLADTVIDFGLGGGSVLAFSALGEHTGGTLSLWNWTGSPGLAGSATDDRLIFAGDPAAFVAAYTQEQVSFDGAAGYIVVPLSEGRYEVTAASAVPEPASAAYLLLSGSALLLRRWRRG